ncbi:MAG: response regulator [Pseudolabrys sp.]|nr:response regulator [Pseudolabrys sp.]
MIDAALSSAECDAVVQQTRELKPRPHVAMFGTAGKRDGVDAVLAQPTNPDEAQQGIERCVRTRLPVRVLVVDDSGTMRSIVRKILGASRYTFEVAEAEEGIAAINELSSGRVDLALLDYNMPGFNGFETLAEIKRVAPHVAVVMMTSTADEAMAEKAMAKGAIAFMKKPFYPADIDAVLERYFSAPR